MTEHQIFAEARSLSDRKREQFLDSACGNDTVLRKRVERLLLLDSSEAALLDREPIAILGELESGDDSDSISDRELVRQQVMALLESVENDEYLGRLGHYNIDSIIGHGGFGMVLKAFDDKLGRPVAIKILSPMLAVTSPPRKRFLREARAAAAVRHENVVQIYSVEEKPQPYIVMEYIDGETLRQRFDRTGPLDPEEVVRIGLQVLAGLKAAHDQGIVHRDIKPSNILLAKNPSGDRAKLTDFGLARAADDATVTRSGCVVGTPMYMAPEQANGQAIDHRTDLFSFGSVLYTLIAGHMPFRAPTTIAVLKRVIDDTPRPLQQVIPETPPGLSAVVERLHQKEPTRRYQSADRVVEDLKICLDSVPGKPIRWGAAAMGLAVCVLAAGFLIAWQLGPRSSAMDAVDGTAGLATINVAPTDTHTEVSSDGVAIYGPSESLSESKTSPARLQPINGESLREARIADTIEKVRTRLSELNPDLDIKATKFLRNSGEITGFECLKPVVDLHPLQMLGDLRFIRVCAGGDAIDLTPLGKLRKLDTLYIEGYTQSLSPLAGLSLQRLHAWGLNDPDLSALKGMPLQTLNCGMSEVRDLSPLKGSPIWQLCLNFTVVDDLSPLAGMPLKHLMIAHTKVTDLSPLKGMPLEVLEMEEAPVQDTSVVATLPLKRLGISFDPIRDADLTTIATLETVNWTPIAEFQKTAARRKLASKPQGPK